MSSARGRSTGKNIGVGLPANPRSRSVSRYDARETERERFREWARESDYMPQRRAPVPPDTPSTRSVRTVRSAASMITPSSSSSSRRGGSSYSYRNMDVPDVPPVPTLPRRSDALHKSSDSSGSSASYLSSASASGSSPFLDRMKGRGRGRGYVSSSRTSLEDDEPEPRKEMGSAGREGWWSRQVPEPEHSRRDDQTRVGGDGEMLPAQLGYGYGLSLWSRVATAASTLTLSVSKAWASNIAAHSGERTTTPTALRNILNNRLTGTPPGEESRLTRTLKAYHIEKARDPTDLPPWLFEEHERRPVGRPGTRLRYREDDEYDVQESRRATVPPRPSGRGLRDVYDAAATETTISSRQQQQQQREAREWGRTRAPPRQDDVPPAPRSIASDRLRAFRDAKRNAALGNASVTSDRASDYAASAREERAVRDSEERGRSYKEERRGDRDGPYHRSPSLPASVRRPPRGGGLPPRPSTRKF
ncbi:hypothetical protein BC827DRAFT_1179126 [Russula dissimulans]|nr:hypothetical protein BC827DRAFT_1179126 [Russula dissimulans]